MGNLLYTPEEVGYGLAGAREKAVEIGDKETRLPGGRCILLGYEPGAAAGWETAAEQKNLLKKHVPVFFVQAGSLWGEAKTELCCALIAEVEGDTEEAKHRREPADRIAKKLDSRFYGKNSKSMES